MLSLVMLSHYGGNQAKLYELHDGNQTHISMLHSKVQHKDMTPIVIAESGIVITCIVSI